MSHMYSGIRPSEWFGIAHIHHHAQDQYYTVTRTYIYDVIIMFVVMVMVVSAHQRLEITMIYKAQPCFC